MADDFRCLEPECSGKIFKSKQSLAGHIRWKRHEGDSGSAPEQLESRSSPSRSSPKLRGETTSAGLGEITPREPLRETGRSAPPSVRESPLQRERQRFNEIMQRPRVETSIFDTSDRLLSQLSRKLISPLMQRVQEAVSISDGLKSLKPPTLPRPPRPPWPF